MADAKTSELFNCSVPEFYKIISDYEKYPEFLQEVKSSKVIQVENNQKLVEFQISIFKTFTYRLKMSETEPSGITWQFASGDLFQSTSGHWKLSEEAGKCRAEYYIEAKFNLFVPGPIAKALVSVNLPSMMSSYHKRVKELYGR